MLKLRCRSTSNFPTESDHQNFGYLKIPTKKSYLNNLETNLQNFFTIGTACLSLTISRQISFLAAHVYSTSHILYILYYPSKYILFMNIRPHKSTPTTVNDLESFNINFGSSQNSGYGYGLPLYFLHM